MVFDIPNAPADELLRCPAARRIGALAHESELLLSHFEHRHHLPVPDHWLPVGRPDLVGSPSWRGGYLCEHKFTHFRYDNPVGSFHPGHRAKWTAHELCHALIGFAWRPDASPLFYCLAGRLAEVLPVALWYFFDEAGLRRCPVHEGAGPLFNAHCASCERAAALGPSEGPVDPQWAARGRAFVEAELAAIAETRAKGTAVIHRYATIDLHSDALAWTAAHRLRLESPEFARFRERFLTPAQGAHETLDSLVSRVREVGDDLAGGPPARPLEGNRALWIAQDVAWRLTLIIAECEGVVVDALDGLVNHLADAPTEQSMGEVIEAYHGLREEWILPSPDDLFAVGYPLPGGYGYATEQVAQGIASVCPKTASLLDDTFEALVDEFVRVETPRRVPVARRFAAFLADAVPGTAADLARYEAAVGHPGEADPEADAFGADAAGDVTHLRLSRGVEILALASDLTPYIGGDGAGGCHLVVRRTSGGEVVIAELSPETAAVLQVLANEGSAPTETLGLKPEELDALRGLGVVMPVNWSELRGPSTPC
jgi:hypothetical protein